ncbi:MAG: hypothetical protein ABI325_00375 [Ginsengibacter sp.]
MKVTSFKHQVQFQYQPIVLEVTILERTWFNDNLPITLISYNTYRNTAEVTTCTFIS